MHRVNIRRFETRDESRAFEKGRFEIVRFGNVSVGRATYEPGWKWSEHVGKALGKKSCDVSHVSMVVSGRAKILMQDGTEYEISAGELFAIPPGHDSWVLGDQAYVSLHFLGADHYAK